MHNLIYRINPEINSEKLKSSTLSRTIFVMTLLVGVWSTMWRHVPCACVVSQLPVYRSEQLHHQGSCIQISSSPPPHHSSNWTQLDAHDNKACLLCSQSGHTQNNETKQNKTVDPNTQNLNVFVFIKLNYVLLKNASFGLLCFQKASVFNPSSASLWDAAVSWSTLRFSWAKSHN